MEKAQVNDVNLEIIIIDQITMQIIYIFLQKIV